MSIRSFTYSFGQWYKAGKYLSYFCARNEPGKVVLEVSVDNVINYRDLWVYPPTSTNISSNAVRHVSSLDANTLNYLMGGGKVLLSLGKVKPEMGSGVGIGFSSIFWNNAWTDQQKPHTLGIQYDLKHSALEQLPTELHSNWQWRDAMSQPSTKFRMK